MRVRTESKRKTILAGAARVFARHGYHATAVGDIATELGIGLGTFYRYFRSKLDVFREVIDLVIAEIARVLADVPVGAESLEAYRVQVRELGDRLLDAFLANRDFARLLFVEAPGIDAALNQKLGETTLLLGAMTAAYLEHGKARGFLRADLDCETTALAINAMVFEGVRQIAQTREVLAAQARWSSAVSRLMFDGMA